MPYRPFIGQSQAWLEKQLAAAQSDLAGGKTISGWNAGDQGANKQVQGGIEKRIQLLLAELYILSPLEYPIDSIRRPDRTRARFGDT